MLFDFLAGDRQCTSKFTLPGLYGPGHLKATTPRRDRITPNDFRQRLHRRNGGRLHCQVGATSRVAADLYAELPIDPSGV